VTDPTDTAVDKSLIAARGPLWHKSDRKRNRIPKKLRGVDRDSDWGCSQHDGWVQGYSFEVVVSSTKDRTVFPLSGSAATASAQGMQTFEEKIDELPEQTETVSADSGYDSNRWGDRDLAVGHLQSEDTFVDPFYTMPLDLYGEAHRLVSVELHVPAPAEDRAHGDVPAAGQPLHELLVNARWRRACLAFTRV
jgi:hypothetical protein